jgi:two-component system phosphate regulon sensor histidine kinase PhoR
MTAKPSSHTQYLSISPLRSSNKEQHLLTATTQKIAHTALELCHLDDCVIALLDETEQNLVVLASSPSRESDQRTVIPLYQEPLIVLAERPQTLLLRNVYLDARLQPLTGETPSMLTCLPLLDQDRLLGVLIARTSTEDAFAEAQLRLLALLAEQAVLAINNARQAEQVRDAERMKVNFLSLVTHELRSPLNTINGYLDLILEGMAGELNEQQQEFIRRARASSEHLYALLEDLLLATRADAGQLRLKRTLTSLDELVAGAIEELEVSAQDSQITLKSELPPDLPPLLIDSVRVQQVLRNLLSNALRATPVGGRITVGARLLPAREQAERGIVEVRVSDTGIGIAPEYHERIFERFFQVPRAEGGRSSGQGLGLSIVKLIVELHGGQIWLESAPGQGSTFIFTLDALDAW